MTRHRHLSFAITAIVVALLLLGVYPAQAQIQENEGYGLLSSDVNGALPKALWRGQPRSEIIYLLQNMPADAPMRAIQQVKRNMLLSTYDVSLLDNDITTKQDSTLPDLLTLRLQKLLQMGLTQDAFTLYTKTTPDPEQNAALAQIGVLLILMEKGLSTACLEEKVLSPRFGNISFWYNMDTICNDVLGSTPQGSTHDFKENPTLQAIYDDSKFTISANATATLNQLSPLELIMLFQKKRIDYTSLTLEQRPAPLVTRLFLNDSGFPEDKKENLNRIAYEQGLISYQNLPASDKMSLSPSKAPLYQEISTQLYKRHKITEEMIGTLLQESTQKPSNYVYIQLLSDSGALSSPQKVAQDNYNLGLTSFDVTMQKKINLLKIALDKKAKLFNNPPNVYEKHAYLMDDGVLQASSTNWVEWWENARKHGFLGLSLLLVLNNIDTTTEALNGLSQDETDQNIEKIGDIPTNNRLDMLKRFSNVGLIEQTRLLAREILAGWMGKEK